MSKSLKSVKIKKYQGESQILRMYTVSTK